MAWVKRSGGMIYGTGLLEGISEIEVIEGPAFKDAEQVRTAPYRREPYVRVIIPGRSSIDAKVSRWSPTHVLVHWEDRVSGVHNAWVPARYVQRIARSESSWTDPYDWHE